MTEKSHKINVWEPNIVERNYDAGRPMSTFKYIDFSTFNLPPYPQIPKLCNPFLVSMRFVQSLRLINIKFKNCLRLHNLIAGNISGQILDTTNPGDLVMAPTNMYKYKNDLENIVYIMRRVLDTLVQLTYILCNHEVFNSDKRIFFDSIGSVLSSRADGSKVKDIIIGGNGFAEDKTEFLDTLNDLSNAYKHTLINDETFNLIGVEVPTIVGLSVRYSDHNKPIYYHNHNSFHIVMGFQDCVIRIIENQKKYLDIR